MQIVKVTSEGPLNWELYNYDFHHHVNISYAPEGFHSYGPNIYHVDSEIYSVEELVKQIPAWANEHKVDMVAIYSKNSDAINNKLAKELQQLSLIPHGNEDYHEFYFHKAYIICDSF